MPGKRSQGGSEDPHGDAAAEKARAVAASRAAAKQYRDSLKVTAKRAASPPDDEGEVSRKKVKRQAGTTPSVSPSSPASMTKESRTLASRRRAKEYAKTLAATKKAAQALAEEEEQQQQQQEGEGEEEKEEGKRLPEAPRNDEQRGVPIADKMVEAFAGIQAPGPFEECKTTGAFGESTGAEATAGSREPEAFGGGEKAKGPVPMDIPAVVAWGELKPGVPDQLGTQQVSDQARPSSTTGEAVPLVPMPMSNRDDALVDGTSAEARQVAMPNLPPLPPVPPMPDVLPSVPRYHPPSDPAPRVSHPASYEGVTEGSFSRSSERREWGQPVRESRPQPAGRKSLRFEGIDSRYERASEPVAMTTRLRQRRVPVPRAEQEPSWPAGTTNPSVTETNGVGASNSTRPARMDGPAGVPPSRIRVRLLTLAPLIVPGFLWGALIPAWPRVKPTFAAVPRAVASVPSALTTAAKSILSSVPRLGPSSGRTEKCFLSSGEDASVCKAGSEPRECPAPATCGLGRILSCEFPYDIAVHGDGCTLTAAAVEEAGIVIKALSDRTIAEQCWGAGLVVPSKPRGGISLKDAARTVDSELGYGVVCSCLPWERPMKVLLIVWGDDGNCWEMPVPKGVNE